MIHLVLTIVEIVNISRLRIVSKRTKYNLLIYVMNSTQLATNDEDEHLEFVKSTIGRTPVIFVMNKIDSYNLEEEDVIATIGRQLSI